MPAVVARSFRSMISMLNEPVTGKAMLEKAPRKTRKRPARKSVGTKAIAAKKGTARSRMYTMDRTLPQRATRRGTAKRAAAIAKLFEIKTVQNPASATP